jgi:protein TonB
MPPPLTETIPAHAFALPPLPEISSLLPVEQLPRPALIQLPATANSRGNAAAPSPSPPSVQTLAFGVGAGKQPAPRYPREALRRGQQGSVEILFSVNRDGAVETAEILSPSPWPLLNQEALRVVRERWNFPPGECRRYRVPIRFKLEK